MNTTEIVEDLFEQRIYYTDLINRNKENLDAVELLFNWDYISEKKYKKIKKKIKKDLDKDKRNLRAVHDRIDVIQDECSHKYEDGKSALDYEGSDSHYDWYICEICRKSIKG